MTNPNPPDERAGMVEAVARAICERMGLWPDRPIPVIVRGVEDPVTSDTPVEWQRWTPVARAAIEAMREPSEEMLTKGLRASGLAGGKRLNSMVSRIYQAMITAALSERSE